MVTTECSQDASQVLVILEPNHSLTWRESVVFFAGAATLSLIIAITLAVMGYWPVLPFAGLELLALGTALYLAAKQGCRRQIITVTADKVRIEKGHTRSRGCSGGGPKSCREFARAWARVRLTKPSQGWYPSRLTIGSAGITVAVGEFLTDEERQGLKTKLEQLLVSANEGQFATPK